jgi:hypothetical protein
MIVSRFEGNEIIYTSDYNDVSQGSVENIDRLMQVIGGKAIISGLTVSEQLSPDMTVRIASGQLYDPDDEKFLLSEEFTNITIAAADVSLDRRDIIEVRRFTEDISPEGRQFRDPITEAISTSTINTETQYKTEVKVITGTPGAVAPSVEAGWMKIAEILILASSSQVLNANIFNVDADREGGSNTSWTTDPTATFYLGSESERNTQLQELDDIAVKPSGSGFADGEIPLFADTTGKAVKTSNKTIQATIADSDDQVPTSGAIVDYIKSAVYPVGATYIQFPGDDSPATAGFPGTWSNVSSELAGDFIRFEGGDALAFTGGQQPDQMQQITGQLTTLGALGGGSGALGSAASTPRTSNPAGGGNDVITFDSANSLGARTGTKTWPENRTVRKWRRTA